MQYSIFYLNFISAGKIYEEIINYQQFSRTTSKPVKTNSLYYNYQ